MPRKSTGLLIAGALSAFVAAGVACSAPISQVDSKPARDLWQPGESRFIRHWQVAGPIGDRLSGDDFAAALEGRDGKSLRWTPQDSWTDLIDLAAMTGAAPYRGHDAALQTAYAYADIHRPAETDEILSLASDGPVRVWLNGKLAFEVSAERTFAFDHDHIPLHLAGGQNRLLLEFGHKSGPWRFAARLLRPGQVVMRPVELAPAIEHAAGGSLIVRTDTDPRRDAADVAVSVVAPGGAVVAQAEAPRGRTLSFQTATWPDGAYEIRFETRTAWGDNAAAHLPWYKGDWRAAAQALLQSAARSTDPQRRMLADLVRARLGARPEAAPDDAWPLVHSALMETSELDQQAAGRPGPIRPYGFVRLAYVDEVDGSTQYCLADLPAHYSADRSWPAVVMLHGFNPPNPAYVDWWGIADRHDPIADRYDVIALHPLGRGNAQYMGIGERDVLHCLAEAKRRLRVDEDRVYLTGESMGGSGTWLIASHHPELFAAAAPVFGGWDYRITPGAGFDNPHADQLPERFAAEMQSSFTGAEALQSLPLMVTHGDSDHTVDPAFSRLAIGMLQRWGYDLRYHEVPGRGHEDLDLSDTIVPWLLSHRHQPAPREARVRTGDLSIAEAYWLHVDAFERPLEMIEADAEVMAPGRVRLDTKNVAALRLTLPPELAGRGTVKIVWNGIEQDKAPEPDGTLRLVSAGDPVRPGDKRPALPGGLSSIISSPFAIVIGTASADPNMRALCRQKAEAFARAWAGWQHVAPRLIRDDALTPEDARRYSLLLIGGPDANLVSRRVAARLPMRVDRNGITIDGRRFAARDAVAEMIYPSPLAPDRSVLMVAATSPEGLTFWDPTAFWRTPFGYPTRPLDWDIRDGRLVTLEPGLGAFRGWVAAGSFDRHWRHQDLYTFIGDKALREASPLRHPVPGFSASPAALAAAAGRYQLLPNVVMTIREEQGTLRAETPGAPAITLTPESDGVFAADGSTIILTRDAQGHVTGLKLYGDGQTWAANRLD